MKDCLIVDDSKVIRMVASRIVHDLGFQTREAANGQVALELCREEMPSVVLLDWNMPVMNGLEFLRELRKLARGGDPKVVFCTTENEMDRIQQAIEEGADEYIMKPFNEDIVEAKFSMIGVL